MNRRGFLRSLGVAVAAFTVLPSATTYARRWMPCASGMWVPNPEWIYAPYEMHFWYSSGVCIPVIEHRVMRRNPTVPAELKGWEKIGENWPMRFDINKKPVDIQIKI